MSSTDTAAIPDSTVGVPLPKSTAATLICRELARTGAALIRRHRRTRARVEQEYGGGYWADVLAARRWQSCRTLEDFLVPDSDRWRISKIDNRFVRVRNRDYYRYRAARLAAILEAYTAPGDDLVEIGSGYGANLFALVTAARLGRLIGFELSQSGVNAGRAIAEHFGVADRVIFEQADVLNLSAAARDQLANRTVFSHYCFEQIPHDTPAAVRSLLDARPRRVIHIEPTAELLRLSSPKDLITYLYMLRMDYQRTLLRTLRQFSARNLLRITASERLFFSPGIRHDPSLIVWEPCRPGQM